jgi:hypothetical protein
MKGKLAWQRDLASSYQRLGGVLEDLKRVREAREAYQKSIGIWEKILRADPLAVSLATRRRSHSREYG